jgi:hypothetical protein
LCIFNAWAFILTCSFLSCSCGTESNSLEHFFMILSLPELNVPLLMHKANKDKKKNNNSRYNTDPIVTVKWTDSKIRDHYHASTVCIIQDPTSYVRPLRSISWLIWILILRSYESGLMERREESYSIIDLASWNSLKF